MLRLQSLSKPGVSFPEVMSAFSIDLYGRFKDDISIVAQDRMFTKQYEANTTKSKLRTFSEVTVKFLQARVWKGSRFVTAPALKSTNLWQPLGYDRAHAPHSHTS